MLFYNKGSKILVLNLNIQILPLDLQLSGLDLIAPETLPELGFEPMTSGLLEVD